MAFRSNKRKKKFQGMPDGMPFSVKMFLLILVCVIIPLNLVLWFVQFRYERHLERELSSKIIQSISKGQEHIGQTFQKMANLSNILVYNESLREAFSDLQRSYFDNTRLVNDVIAEMVSNNLFDMDDLSIILMDGNGQLYGNWDMLYTASRLLITQDWIRDSIVHKGHIVWNMFSGPYGKEGRRDTQYISLARSILADGTTGQYLGSVIISIQRDKLGDMLIQYAYDEKDCIYLSTEGTTVLRYDHNKVVGDETLRSIQEQTVNSDTGSTIVSIGGNRYLVSYYSISDAWYIGGNRLKLFHFSDYRQIDRQINQISGLITTVTFLSFAFAVAAALLVIRWMSRPIRQLADRMDTFTMDAEAVPMDTKRRDEIGRLNNSYNTMSRNIRQLFAQLNHEYAVREKYRFESLRAQLNPHFLFNTLNSIRWMSIIRQADNITQSIDALANMLKFSMDRGDELATLREELDNVQDYVFIQNIRYGDRFTVDTDIDESLMELKVIRFILQPIVENATIHAFKDTGGEGVIRITAWRKDDQLILSVQDNGSGMSPEQLNGLLADKEKHHKNKVTGIGVINVDERIRVSYGNAYGLRFESEQGQGTRVIYTLPILDGRTDDDQADDCG